jgi:fumarate reductase flavoprotein subunit
MCPDNKFKDEDIKADVVVVGGGGAGLSAAVTAAEKGASVIVLEVRQVVGGNTALAGGVFSTRNPGQEKDDVSSSNDDYFKKQMRYAHWRTNPRIVRTLIDKSENIIGWLEKQGVEFIPDNSMPGHPMYRIVGPGRGGVHVTKALAKKCEKLGVRVVCQTRARKLITERQKVTGVLAETEGKEIKIKAESIVLASGGFAGNKEMLRKYLPSFYEEDEMYLQGLPHQGDGLAMATGIGAATDGSILLEISGLIFPWAERLAILARHPEMTWVNKKGERFFDESVGFPEFTNAIFRQPAKVFYALFDEKTKQGILKKPISPMDAANIAPGSWPSQVDKDLESQSEKGRVKKCDSWEEMAAWIGSDLNMLKMTIDEYNMACDHGHDPVFAKGRANLLPLRVPPYYAVKCCVSLLVTHGDIKINNSMEVLDKQGNPIPGLYAAGDDTGDVDAGAYNIGLPGHSFGFAINSGRIAGENAAGFASIYNFNSKTTVIT